MVIPCLLSVALAPKKALKKKKQTVIGYSCFSQVHKSQLYYYRNLFYFKFS